MGERWPSLRGSRLVHIVEKHCGPPLRRSGSHRRYQGRQRKFTVAYHDNADISGSMVRRILMEDVGLTEAEARSEVG